jgi:hypothetical protein
MVIIPALQRWREDYEQGQGQLGPIIETLSQKRKQRKKKKKKKEKPCI